MEKTFALENIDVPTPLAARERVLKTFTAILNRTDELDSITIANLPLFQASLLFSLLSSIWMQWSWLVLPILIMTLLAMNIGYISKRSGLKSKLEASAVIFEEGSSGRTWSDPVVTTNVVYLLAAIVSATLGLHHLAFLHFLTFSGSSLYHLNREIYYFNMDHIFAMTVFFIAVYSIYDSYFNDIYYFSCALLLFPAMMFLIAYCGMPSEIAYRPCLCCRQSRLQYDKWHSIWHMVSGVGPICYSFYYAAHYPEDISFGCGCLDTQCMFPFLPVASIVASVIFNIILNVIGVAPLH